MNASQPPSPRKLSLVSGRAVIFEPQWFCRQHKRVKPEDSGLARVLIEDEFPPRLRAVVFDAGGDDPYAPCFVEDPDPPADARDAGGGCLRTETGSLAIADLQRLIEAMALWRDPERILDRLPPMWRVQPGLYEFTVWRRDKTHDLFFHAAPVTEEDIGADYNNPEALLDAEPQDMPLTDELDLHAFAPNEAAAVIEEYCHLAAEAGFGEVRIIHGRGVGELRATAHRVLERHPAVMSYADAPPDRGGPGATIAHLAPRES